MSDLLAEHRLEDFYRHYEDNTGYNAETALALLEDWRKLKAENDALREANKTLHGVVESYSLSRRDLLLALEDLVRQGEAANVKLYDSNGYVGEGPMKLDQARAALKKARQG